MTAAELWWVIIQGIAVGATIFGLIVAVFSVYNGRMTRQEISHLIEREEKATRDLIERVERTTREQGQATRDLIAQEMAANRLLLEKLSDQHERMLR